MGRRNDDNPSSNPGEVSNEQAIADAEAQAARDAENAEVREVTE